MVRKDESTPTSDSDKDNFIKGIKSLIASGDYGKLVAIHGDMKHQMHGTMWMNGKMMEVPVGRQRFLPWHRVYLYQLEQKLKSAGFTVAIPYWDWMNNREFPKWLLDFEPTVTVKGKKIQVQRDIGNPNDLPSQGDFNSMKKQNDYTKFTTILEDALHNPVHGWVGGTMGDKTKAPADPVFWLHHSNVDRLWAGWQPKHTDQNPNLSGKNVTMDPWKNKELETRKTINFNYTYDKF